MHILEFTTRQDAEDFSIAAMDKERGRAAGPFDVTVRLWRTLEHPRNQKGAVVIPDNDDQSRLTVDERARLKTEATAKAEGWYDEIVVVRRVETLETFEAGD